MSKLFRSGLEESIRLKLNKQFKYEPYKIPYIIQKNYLPDFVHEKKKILIEAKGFFKPADRRKMLAIKKQYPDLDIRFVFQRNNTLSKNSKTHYGDWCDKHGFPWCIYPNIPPSWLPTI